MPIRNLCSSHVSEQASKLFRTDGIHFPFLARKGTWTSIVRGKRANELSGMAEYRCCLDRSNTDPASPVS